MRWLAFIAVLGCVQVGAATYDDAPELIATTPQRSRYFVHTEYDEQKPGDFLAKADRSAPLVIHAHGCQGFINEERNFNALLRLKGINFVSLDFLARGNVDVSCPSRLPEPGGHPEVANPERIRVRRLELERQVEWARENGFRRIWVTGHSEGGRVVQGLKAKVDGVMIFGMDCKNTAFWTPNPANAIHVFLSRRDDWLDWPRSPIRGCGGLFDANVKHHWTNVPGHALVLDAEWYDTVPALIKQH